VVLHRYRISNPYVLKYIDNPKFTQTAKSNLENKDSKTGVLNLQGCKSKAKFEAWDKVKTLSKIMAKKEYINLVEELKLTYGFYKNFNY